MLSYLNEGIKKRGPGYEQHVLDDSGGDKKPSNSNSNNNHQSSTPMPMPVERPLPAASQPMFIQTPPIQPFSTPPPPGSLLANFLAFDMVATEKARAKDREATTIQQTPPPPSLLQLHPPSQQTPMVVGSPAKSSPFSSWLPPPAQLAPPQPAPPPPRSAHATMPTIVTTPPPPGYSSRPILINNNNNNSSSSYTLAASGNAVPLPPVVAADHDRSYAALAASAYDSESVLRDLTVDEQRKFLASASPPKDINPAHHMLAVR